MRSRLGVLLMEDAEGKVSVELFKDPDRAREAVEQLAGKPGDPPSRATFIDLDWSGESGVAFSGFSTELPKRRSPDDEPWGHRLGVGPIEKPEDSGESGV